MTELTSDGQMNIQRNCTQQATFDQQPDCENDLADILSYDFLLLDTERASLALRVTA